MYFRENPVLQRELLVNLRMPRAFVLMALYQGLLGLLVVLAWPQDAKLNLADRPESTRILIDLCFLGQFTLASLMAPTFAAGTITGEKERKTYEMLLASPLKPEAIVMGKIVASLSHLGLLIFTSLPIVVLCLPLGGVSIYEVLAAYLAILLTVLLFGLISVAASSYFKRTSASLLVSYLIILPLAAVSIALWLMLRDQGALRINLILTVLPTLTIFAGTVLYYNTSKRMVDAYDVGSEGKEVVDVEEENKQAVGLVIDRTRFPDRLFAPPASDDLMQDGRNPVYEKELHSEIFAQGTLMLRLVIQISMLLAIPMMAGLLFFFPGLSFAYIGYVIVFNVLVGPVFSAGSVTGERERQTLDLLLTTNISPWKILWGKLISGLRVSSVLTLFLVWPLVIAAVLVSDYYGNMLALVAFLIIIATAALTTSQIALTCSSLFQKSAHSLIASYLVILLLFLVPLACNAFAVTFFNETEVVKWTGYATIISPFAAAYHVPFVGSDFDFNRLTYEYYSFAAWSPFLLFLGWSLLLNSGLMGLMLWLFRSRWRVSEQGA